MNKPITCMACELTTVLDGDLDSDVHAGFTVGKKGKVLYWYFIWHGNTTGNATVFTSEIPARKSYIKGDQIITIHFKNKP